jgi:hypothetical protein
LKKKLLVESTDFGAWTALYSISCREEICIQKSMDHVYVCLSMILTKQIHMRPLQTCIIVVLKFMNSQNMYLAPYLLSDALLAYTHFR